jgi:hypothetical protein
LPNVMEQKIVLLMRNTFGYARTFLFRNPATFPTAHSILDYWKSYYLYDPKHEKRFRSEVRR